MSTAGTARQGGVGEPELRALVDGALTGDRTAIGMLLREVQRMVSPYCRRRLTGLRSTSVEDVLQEIAIGVLEALPRIGGDRAIRPYLFTLARNKVVDAFRSAAPLADVPVELLPETADPAPGPAEVTVTNERAARARDLIGRLPERDREVLSLRLMGQLSNAETAAVLSMTDGAVRVAQHRALQKLRAMLADPGS